MKEHRKPTGELGLVSTGTTPGVDPFERVQFPTNKADIEDFVLRLTSAGFEKANLSLPWPGIPGRNPENHFDYTIKTSPPEYLDLMEVALIPRRGGYDGIDLHQNYGESVDKIWTRITKKASGYGRAGARRLHLLLYTTDFAFRFFPDFLQLLSYHFHVSNRGFSSVVWAVPDSCTSASVATLYPKDSSYFSGFSLLRARSRVSRVGDPTSVRVDSGGGVFFKFPPQRLGKP